MDWLHPFIALTLCCGVILTLLPDGSLRRTAALVIGLMMTLCWADSLSTLFKWPSITQTSGSMLTDTGWHANEALADDARTLGGE